MKKAFLTSVVILNFFFSSAFSQDQEKPDFRRNQIGIQFNPYINQDLFTFSDFYTVSALRYNYRITKNLSAGLEFSYIFPVVHESNFRKSQYAKIGLITRYSVRPMKRFQMFAEASPYILYIQNEGFQRPEENFLDHRYAVYVAPGVSIYSKSQRFSFDLYYKFSNRSYIYGKQGVVSYKFNYNF